MALVNLPKNILKAPTLMISFLALTAVANTQMQTEIEHLLGFISKSSCIFVRNGKEYVPTEAISHIKKKAKYYDDKIDSAERFIALSASMSTMSKKPYHIKCPEKDTITSQSWLLEELQRFRQKKSI